MKSPLAALRKGFENLARNWLTTIPTIIVISIVLTMLNGLLVVNTKSAETMQNIQQKFSLTFYLKDSADPFEVGNLITTLEQRSDIVKPVTYTSKEAAWKLMSKTFSLDNELLKKYKFSLPASITITPKTPQDAPKIESFLNDNAKHLLKDPLASQDKQKTVTAQMTNFIKSVQNTMLNTIIFFTILFVVGGTLLISSAIHLTITSRKIEMNIMKLVGASYSTIAAPFVVEGLLIAVFGFAVQIVLLGTIPMEFMFTRSNLNLLLLEFIGVLLISGLASYFTAMMHVKKSI